MMKEDTIYDKYSVNKLILVFSVPAIISLILEMLTSVVDTAFAGHLGLQSTNALSAMGLLTPLFSMFVALQTLYAVPTAVMISKALGQQSKEKLGSTLKCGITMTLLVSLITSLVVFLFKENILIALGAKGEVYLLAKQFLGIALISNVISSLGYTLSGAIRAFGNPKSEAIIISTAVFANILFNAIFTFGLKIGFIGLAFGTLASELVCLALCIGYFIKNKLWVEGEKTSPKEFMQTTLAMFKIGFSQTAIQIMAGISGFVINNRLVVFGSIDYVAGWGMINRLYVLLLMPIVGITQGVQSVIAYFQGKKDGSHKKQVVRTTIVYCVIYGFLVTLQVFLLGKYMLYLFTSSDALIELILPIVKVIFITFPLQGIIYTVMTLLQVTDREVASVALSLTRQVILFLPLIIMLPMVFSKIQLFGITPAFSVFLAVPIADILTIFPAAMLIGRHKNWNSK